MTTITGVVCTGDSICAASNGYFFQAFGWNGIGAAGNVPMQRIGTWYASGIIGRNMAVPGTRLKASNPYDLVPLLQTDIVSLIPAAYLIPPYQTTRKYILTNAIGSNDGAIDGYKTPDLYAVAVAAALQVARTAGYGRIGMSTLLPRNDGVMSETNRTTFNSTITAGGWAAAHSIDGIIDLASQVTMGNPANCSNTTYFVDGVHPTTAGHALLAPIYLAGVNALIALG